MKFSRRTLPLLFAALFPCLAALTLQGAAPDEVRSALPDGGIVYGELSPAVIQKSPLFARLKAKYPKLQELMDKSSEKLGGVKGELDTLDFMVDFQETSRNFALLCAFDRAIDRAKILAELDAQGVGDRYEKVTVAGRESFVSKESNSIFGRTSVVVISDRVMLVCPESSAEAMITGKKLPANVARKLRTGEKGVFFRLLPGTAALPPEADVKDYEATGTLNADSSLSISSYSSFGDEESAKNMVQQINAYMFMGIGALFADDSELGMDLMNRVKVKRSGKSVRVDALLPAELIERLTDYTIVQAEKKRQERIEREKRRAERRRQAELQQKKKRQDGGAPAAQSASPARSASPAPAR